MFKYLRQFWNSLLGKSSEPIDSAQPKKSSRRSSQSRRYRSYEVPETPPRPSSRNPIAPANTIEVAAEETPYNIKESEEIPPPVPKRISTILIEEAPEIPKRTSSVPNKELPEIPKRSSSVSKDIPEIPKRMSLVPKELSEIPKEIPEITKRNNEIHKRNREPPKKIPGTSQDVPAFSKRQRVSAESSRKKLQTSESERAVNYQRSLQLDVRKSSSQFLVLDKENVPSLQGPPYHSYKEDRHQSKSKINASKRELEIQPHVDPDIDMDTKCVLCGRNISRAPLACQECGNLVFCYMCYNIYHTHPRRNHVLVL